MKENGVREEEEVGVLVGKNQKGPNYRNHNESVSRGTLLPGKHQGMCMRSWLCTTSTPTLTRTHECSKECRSAQVQHICFTVFAKNYTEMHTGAHACVSTCTQTHEDTLLPKPSVDPDN